MHPQGLWNSRLASPCTLLGQAQVWEGEGRCPSLEAKELPFLASGLCKLPRGCGPQCCVRGSGLPV